MNKQRKAIILCSGGVDSVTALYLAKSEGFELHVLSVKYGQKADKEVEMAKINAEKVGASFKLIDISDLKNVLETPLINKEIKEELNFSEGDSKYIVPFRNAIFLSIAVGYAESILADTVFIGNHLDDALGFPDCRKEFIDAFQSAVYQGTAKEQTMVPTIRSPWLNFKKSEIIKKGISLGVDYGLTWSCYQQGEKHCGVCESCEFRKIAFAEVGIKDPTQYLE